jgi:hypothetical protein
MKIVSVLNQEHVLRGFPAPRICCNRHLSEVRDQFRAPAPLPRNWKSGDSHGRFGCFRQDKGLFHLQGFEQRFPGLVHSMVTMLTELYRLPDFTRKSALCLSCIRLVYMNIA